MGANDVIRLLDSFTYIITGFLQASGTRTRLIELWQKLHAESRPRKDVVRLLPWASDWESEAEFIQRLSDGNYNIRIAAYSWGAGWGSIQLCKALQRRGMDVSHLALIDPVHRHPNPLRRWRTLFPGCCPIEIPSNATANVLWFGQTQNWPRSHKIVGEDKHWQPPKMINISCTHQNMDDHYAVIESVYKFIQRDAGD